MHRTSVPHRASVGLAVMAKDAEKTLPNLLKSVRPYVTQIVVGVDERSTDRTDKVAKKYGADEVFKLHVSDPHECVIHEKALAQHFGNARQETFEHLDRNLEWWLWLDADDVLVGGERIKEFLDQLPEDTIGAWLKYEYAAVTRADGERKVNTLFHRERFLRTHFHGEPVNWKWKGRVHETVEPGIQASWALNEDVVVVHQPGAHVTNDSAPRNLLLLEMDYEEEVAEQGQPTARTLFYLGNQHFALGHMPEAISWYEQLTSGIGQNPYENWQAYVYMSIAYEQLNDPTNALRAAQCAMEVVPIHGEPYFRMAAIYNLTGEYEKAIFWNKIGRMQTPAPFFAFKNPLDYSFNQRVVQGEAYYRLGRITEAQTEWHAAAQVFIDDRLAGAIHDAGEAQSNIRTAESFVELAEKMDELGALGLYQHLPEPVKAFGRTRDVVMPTLLRGRNGTQPRIVFWCGRAMEPWAPPSLNTTGIGGSETAVIEIAKRFAKDGWTVDVFNEAERYEGIYEGVGYWDLKRFGSDEKADVFVSWRNPAAYTIPCSAGTKVLWCHDLNYGPDLEGHFHQWDKVLGVSQWHADMLRRYYYLDSDPRVTGEKSWYYAGVGYVPNGIDLSRYAEPPVKVPYQCVYASSPDRGLDTLLNLWPKVLEVEPEATLQVAYGWDTIDKMIANGRDDLAGFKAVMQAKIEQTPNVTWRGRLPQDELAKLYAESVAWTYPTDFLEVSCISAMEAMAGGCIPVATACGALPETVGDAGFLIPGPTKTRGFQDTYPRVLLGVLLERNLRETYAEQARRRATGLSWDAAYARWLSVLGLEPKRHTTYMALGERELVTA